MSEHPMPDLEALIDEAREMVRHPVIHFHYTDGGRVMKALADALISEAREAGRLRLALTQAAMELDEAAHIMGGYLPRAAGLFNTAADNARQALSPPTPDATDGETQ